MGYGGKYTQVKDAVRELLQVKQEVFMPLIHRPREAQVDFEYALAKVSLSNAAPNSRLFIYPKRDCFRPLFRRILHQEYPKIHQNFLSFSGINLLSYFI